MQEKTITAPRGFRAAGLPKGSLSDPNISLALIACDQPAAVAGVYTSNVIKGHSLQLTLERVATERHASALLINAGNANACVGQQGVHDARDMAALTAQKLGVPETAVLVGSTGVIGVPLPMNALAEGIDQIVDALSDSPEAGHQANAAMLTTDTTTKEMSVDFPMAYDTVTLSGMAKGSGMIHPNMATMIAVLTTDARISPDCLQQALSNAVYQTFNRISVDGDTSCCDMVIIFASGQAEHPMINDLNSAEGRTFQENLNFVAAGLSRMIAADGEGATKLLDVQIKGAATPDAAYRAALAVAKSPLVKTAIFGEDANWGRILNAVGYSGAQFDPTRVDIYIGDLCVCQNGMGVPFDEVAAKKLLQRKEVTLYIHLNNGYCDDHYWTCDFSHDYIRINADYRS